MRFEIREGQSSASFWASPVWFWLVVVLGLCFYLPFLSRNYDLNGLAEVQALDSGRAGDLFNPNHMLYRPVAFVVQRVLAAAGIGVSSLALLQGFSAIFGALGMGLIFLTVRRMTSSGLVAFWASLLLGVSWSYWTLSTDVYYYSMAAMFAAAALYFFVRSDSIWSFVACGVFAGVAILACEANIFLIPGFCVALLIREPIVDLRWSIQRAIFICLVGAAVVGITFVGAGVLVYGQRSAAGLLQWASNYTGNALPTWGSWAPERIVALAESSFKSVLSSELWLFPVLRRVLRNGVLPGWVSLLGFAILAGGLIAAFRWGITRRKYDGRTVLWLLVLYLAYMPFILWWEAVEPRWFILPNIFLAVLVAVVVSRWTKWRYFKFALAAILLLVSGINFATSTLPKRLKTSLPAKMAACVASHMEPNDLFVASEWNWAGYLPFVHRRDMISFISEVSRTGDKNLAIQSINAEILKRQKQGGRVFMIDVRSYAPVQMQWLQDQTKLTAADFNAYSGQRTFDCLESKFFQLDPR